MQPFTKLLVANRGEIACRVLLAAKAKGLRTVAVFSDADADARHARLADEAVHIGPAPVAESYLRVGNILAAAKASGAEAIHPGYGFLSEDADFAQACIDAGLVFIGPSPAAIRAMGNKAAAKRLMIEAGVPCVPGYQGDAQDDETLIAEAARIGFPIMVKAAAGGGGRGMRLVADADELGAALRSARSEARNAFGSGELILEKTVAEPRHVEIQVMADGFGNVVHLFERDCSVQRRHQKVLEEAPCPALTPDLREKMGAAAVRAAAAIAYRGAGTVEFLLDASGSFYFLEMNTRIQVEHPVTEMVTGQDLVAMQIDVAMGKLLPFRQADIPLIGHAIEARLYAEDPAADFLPQTGEVLAFAPATGPGVRIDHGMVEGGEISPFYDPMIAKVIAHGATRDEARLRLIDALEQTLLLGVPTNKAFLVDMLRHPVFAKGDATTAFIATHFPDIARSRGENLAHAFAAVLSFAGTGELFGWASTGAARCLLRLAYKGAGTLVEVLTRGVQHQVTVNRETFDIRMVALDARSATFAVDGVERRLRYTIKGRFIHLDLGAQGFVFEDVTYAPAEAASVASSDGLIRAPMNGRIVVLCKAQGDAIRLGETLLVLEAMKMEHQITAPLDGVVDEVRVAVNQQVATRDVLLTCKEASDGD